MILWVAIALLTVVAVAIIAYPLIRQRGVTEATGHQAAVYEDQLGEIERDLSRNLVSTKEAASVRTEINRRISQLKDEAARTIGLGSFAFRGVSLAMIALLLPLSALGIYSTLGSPELPDAPFITRRAPAATIVAGTTEHSPADQQAMANLISGLANRLKTNPTNLDGWLLLGRSYFQIRKFDKAANALQRARELAPNRADIQAAHGEMVVIRDRGMFSDSARQSFATALAINPREERSLFYSGLDFAQQGRHLEALQSWVDLKAVSQPGAAWLGPLKSRMAEVSKESGINPATLVARVGPKSPGPTQAGIEGAQQTPSGDQLKMVRSMVRDLAARLELNPADPQGWQRLIRAYRVLGQEQKARKAEQQFLGLQQRHEGPRRRPQPQVNRRGPTQEDIKNARRLSTRERVQMIEDMVQRLADRLKGNPDDLAGWQQLARSYRVMGRLREARAADARVAELEKRLADAPQQAVPSAPQPPGPSRAEIDAARQLSPTDRQEMIRGMVKRLADRLKDNPNDLAGWQRLARAYRVMGETAKATEAQSRVDALLKVQQQR